MGIEQSAAEGETELETYGTRREAFVWFGRRLYYRDSYGQLRQDRRSQYRSGTPARLMVIALGVLAVIIVVASLLQSFYHWLFHFHG